MKPFFCLLIVSAALAQQPQLKTGPNADFAGALLMPTSDEWNRDVSKDDVDPLSDAIISFIGAETGLHEDFGIVWKGQPGGIPYYVVNGDQPKVPIAFEYADESDPGPYPIPPDAHIEGGLQAEGDRHVLVLDKDNWKLYELFHSFPLDGGKSWKASSGAPDDRWNHEELLTIRKVKGKDLEVVKMGPMPTR